MENKEFASAQLNIQMLGHFRVFLQKEIVQWPTQKCKSLFQILLVEPGRFISKEQLLDYLWPKLTHQKAQNNLWVTISQLRRVLEPGLPARSQSSFIIKGEDGYYFNIESDYSLDIEIFATNLTAANTSNSLKEKINIWEATSDLYKSDYVEDDPYAEWIQNPRKLWQRRYEKLLSSLADAYIKTGNFKQAILQCRKILAFNNTNEKIYRLLIRCYISLRERAEALKVYDELVKVLKDELGLEPMPKSIELAQQIGEMEGQWEFEVEQREIGSPFVGRNKEVELITQLLNRASTNQGSVLIIKGEPGIGKTRLVKETSLLAGQHDFLSLTAQCYKMEQSLPYQALIDLVYQLMESDPEWKGLSSIWLRELAILVPEMNEIANVTPIIASMTDEIEENQQVRLFQSFFHLFLNQTTINKLVLIIEDIQWADSASLQCFHYLARHIKKIPALLIFTMRDENLSSHPELYALLQSLEGEIQNTTFSLSRLRKKDTKNFLGQILDSTRNTDKISNWFQQETDGNPFFLVSLIQSLREEGLLKDSGRKNWLELSRSDPSLALPEAIQNSVRDRLQRLNELQRDVLDWMSVFGRSLDFSAIQKISKQPHISLLNIVEQLTGLQLIEESLGQYYFNHNKIREVVYHDLSVPRRELYHQQIGVSLESSNPDKDMASILAYHFEEGGNKNKALDYWMQAGEYALSAYAYEPAVKHFERVLALTEDPSLQMDAYYSLGQTLMLMDNYKMSAGVFKQGLQISETPKDDSRIAKLLYGYAQNASRQHRPDGAKKEVEAALQAAEEAKDDHYQAQSLLLLTEVYESSGDLSSALETATRAQIVSSHIDNTQLEARALVEIGFLNAQQGDFDSAAMAAKRGLKLLEPTGDRNAIAYAWNILGRALGGRGNYGGALDAFESSEDEAKRVGDRYLLAQVLNMKGWLYRELGDYENALKFDQEGVKLAKLWGKSSPEISARLNVCLDVEHLGNPGRALEMLRKIETEIEVGAFGFHKWRWRLRLLHTRGICYLSLKEPKKALLMAKEGLILAEKNVTRKYVALNHELLGLAYCDMGSTEKAIKAFETAVFQAENINYQPIRWHSRIQLAKLYKEMDRLNDAEQYSTEAEGIIHAIADALEDETLKKIFLNSLDK